MSKNSNEPRSQAQNERKLARANTAMDACRMFFAGGGGDKQLFFDNLNKKCPEIRES